MIKDRSIIIKNIYYMLTYAYQNLQRQSYDNIATEEFDNIQDLFAAILSKGVTSQLKQGLSREYIDREETLSSLRGKIKIADSINLKIKRSNTLVCCYDEMSENNYMNQIIKTVALLLISSNQVKISNKASLKRIMLYFSEVDIADPTNVRWDMLRYHRNNQTYRMLMNVCYLVLEGLLLSTDSGKYKLTNFLDNQAMSRLYEKFLLEYYKKHFNILHASPAQIPWNIDDDIRDFLPTMKTDISLTRNGKTLIIDAKYYAKSMQTYAEYDSIKIHSSNLYQIFTYVKNKDSGGTGDVSGMLLYAKTDEDITPNRDYMMGGNKISVRTLDLNCSFALISQTLNNIAHALLV